MGNCISVSYPMGPTAIGSCEAKVFISGLRVWRDMVVEHDLGVICENESINR